MAIGITGQNHGVVGPRTYVHDRKYNLTTVFGCIDPANKKSYPGSGNTITDFISGVTFSTFGNSGDVTFKTEAMGCFELTGNGYIESSDKKYEMFRFQNSEINGGYGVEFWIYATTGHTQQEAILQFGQDDNGVFKNGFKLIRNFGPTVANKRTLQILLYDRFGGLTGTIGVAGSNNGGIVENEWCYIVVGDADPQGSGIFRTLEGVVCAPPVKYDLVTFANRLYPSQNSSTPPVVEQQVPRKLTIGKADGITGQFRGKVGFVKVYEGALYTVNVLKDIDDQNTGEYVLPGLVTLNQAAFAKRYGHPDDYLNYR